MVFEESSDARFNKRVSEVKHRPPSESINKALSKVRAMHRKALTLLYNLPRLAFTIHSVGAPAHLLLHWPLSTAIALSLDPSPDRASA